MTERLYVLSGKCVVAGERIKLFMSWRLLFCSSVTNVFTIAINLLIRKKKCRENTTFKRLQVAVIVECESKNSK